jgi:gamma-glutamyltranspeptidase
MVYDIIILFQFLGWEAVAVPGELYGLWVEFKHFGGHLAWHSLIKPTIDLMEEGILVC